MNPVTQSHPDQDAFEITRLRTLRQYDAVSRFQLSQMGLSAVDSFPCRLMTVINDNGGFILGALRGGRLEGFVLSFLGWRYGRLVDWSYMLAVCRERLGTGLDLKLKRAQRRRVLATGRDLVCWAVDPADPLAASRALHALGATASECAFDFPEPIMQQPGGVVSGYSERLIIRWRLDDERVGALAAGERDNPEWGRLFRLADTAGIPFPIEPSKVPQPATEAEQAEVALPVPAGVYGATWSCEAARSAWRRYLAASMANLFERGYRAEDFVFLDGDESWGWYVLRKAE